MSTWASQQTVRTRGEGYARLRLLHTLCPHALPPGLFAPRGEHRDVRRCYCRPQAVRFWRGDCCRRCFRWIGERSVGGISPTGERKTDPMHELQGRHCAALECVIRSGMVIYFGDCQRKGTLYPRSHFQDSVLISWICGGSFKTLACCSGLLVHL